MNNTPQSDKVENIKIGTLIKRTPTAKKAFLRLDYCRYSKKYTLQDYDDANRFIYVKKGTVLLLDWITNDD